MVRRLVSAIHPRAWAAAGVFLAAGFYLGICHGDWVATAMFANLATIAAVELG